MSTNVSLVSLSELEGTWRNHTEPSRVFMFRSKTGIYAETHTPSHVCGRLFSFRTQLRAFQRSRKRHTPGQKDSSVSRNFLTTSRNRCAISTTRNLECNRLIFNVGNGVLYNSVFAILAWFCKKIFLILYVISYFFPNRVVYTYMDDICTYTQRDNIVFCEYINFLTFN